MKTKVTEKPNGTFLFRVSGVTALNLGQKQNQIVNIFKKNVGYERQI